uniref:NADH-ubiquinone oxidoreductase chain 6 n=1 Tax=Protanguilla palau TaxID=1405575 RepID=G2HK25_9TELE|nr:NADH dehydrogenase subunit 6 [Protanguilla palau]
MSFFIILLSYLLLELGVVVVASNPAPYFAAFGLVMAAAGGCGILAGYGGSFMSLVLFLIYLGGMLVVFAYSAALAAEPYPETLGDWTVLGYVVGYVLLSVLGIMVFCGGWLSYYCGLVDEYCDFSIVCGDLGGVSFMYSLGGWVLFVCGWVLLLTLFVVFELVRGYSRGALRAIYY